MLDLVKQQDNSLWFEPDEDAIQKVVAKYPSIKKRTLDIQSTQMQYFKTEDELRNANPWLTVADQYERNEFLYADKSLEFICPDDKSIIDAFNKTAKDDCKYILNVPVYPWLGNPLRAKVIILSLNPGYSERETIIAKLLKYVQNGLVEGVAVHLRNTLTFDSSAVLPRDLSGNDDISYRDIANLRMTWYWWDRFTNGLATPETKLSIDDVLEKTAIVQYVGYSSKSYAPFKKGTMLPSQRFTKALIKYILDNNPDTLFIVPRNIKIWREFLGEVWDDNRFIEAYSRGQWLNKKVLGDNYSRVISALK